MYRVLFHYTASVNPNGSSCPIALKLVACVLLMEITTFLRETYRNLPRANRPIGSRFLEPRVSQMWGISGSEARPPTRGTGIVQNEHGQSLLSATGSSGNPTLSASGRRWSTAAQSVVNQAASAVQGNTNTLAANSQQTSTSALASQQSTAMSPSDTSVTPPSTSVLIRGNSTTTTVTTANVTAGETRRISFVIQDDAESITSSQTTLAVQVSIAIKLL